jgi:phosphoserine phosphatase
VVYSERVREALKATLARAVALGIGREVLEAVKVIDDRLRIYPQFGEPLQDLAMAGQTVWIGTVQPFVVRYVIDEERRLVFVILPFEPFSHLGL